MSHFAHLRQRIRVIQTIHKTTGAMRLIAMSLQGRLRKRELVFKRYTDAMNQVHEEQQALRLALPHAGSEEPRAIKPLIILVGSHKGLCGAFNQHMFTFFHERHHLAVRDALVTVGTQATKWLKQQGYMPLAEYNVLSIATFVQVAVQITERAIAGGYTEIIIFSTMPRTFFIQEPTVTRLTAPLVAVKEDMTTQEALYAYLDRLTLQSAMVKALYESLLAEQAARFLSMDNATRSAEKLLQETKLEYNKVRQARVTRELIELTSGYMAQE